MDRAMRLPLK